MDELTTCQSSFREGFAEVEVWKVPAWGTERDEDYSIRLGSSKSNDVVVLTYDDLPDVLMAVAKAAKFIAEKQITELTEYFH
jgi:hypothetical protein